MVSHLLYADNTLCIGKPTVENLWTLKAVLRGFKMASGLKVNFFQKLFDWCECSFQFYRYGV